MIEATPGNEIPKLIEEADQLFSDQKFEDSLKLFALRSWVSHVHFNNPKRS